MKILQPGETYISYKRETVSTNGNREYAGTGNNLETTELGIAHALRREPRIDHFIITPIHCTHKAWPKDDIKEPAAEIIYRRTA